MRAAALFAVITALAATLSAAVQRPLIMTSQDHSLLTIDDCDHFYSRTVSSFPAQAQSQEQHAVPLAGVGTLRVKASDEGGISIKGWDRPVARLTVCKYAVALTQVDADRTLRDVGVTWHNGDIWPSGPASDANRTWWVHLILRVPRTAAVDVSGSNGGIAIRNMSGRVTARATNGAISIASCDGQSTITTENGGISLENITGRMDATTQNGPISIKLQSGSAHPTIEARTEDLGEIRCRARACIDSQPLRNGGTKVLRISGGLPLIRLSTGTAPILIEQVR